MKTEINELVSEVRVVLMTFPNLEAARQIGTHLVESQLIACINLVPTIESIYQWEGKVQSETEVLAIAKTTAKNAAQLVESITDLHPYDVPECLVLELSDGLKSYLKWVTDSSEGAKVSK